ncbi:MAG: Sec-independent protein translocase protein TatB [Paracoccaceae bacterium]|nr:MAG: Sec-independent protein translocase protein TatB [Paracoccaceae bacterium]
MFDIGWTELLLIGIVALIVIGPKDLPEMFRTLGRFTAKARGMAREFSRAMEAAADESGVKDVAKDIRNAANMPKTGMDAVKEAARKFETWDPLKATKAAAPKAAKAASTVADPGAADPGAVEPAPAPARPMGPATQALAEAQAAKRAEAEAQAATLRQARSPGKAGDTTEGTDG